MADGLLDKMITGIQGAATSLSSATVSPLPLGLGTAGEILASVAPELSGVGESSTGSLAGLIGLQIQLQEELQATSLVSNVEKSRHESKMSAIRNVRTN